MTTQATPAARKMPAPLMNPEAQPWFDATAQGRLTYKQCGSCGKSHHPPRSICPHCFSDATQWKTSTGLGTVYSCSVLRRGTPVPYCIAYVTLDEGVTMLSNLVDCDFDAVRIGMRVKVRFTEADGGAKMPVFAPAEGRAP
ncbi:MAG: hypothetical protein JWQ07_3944 [Ramlibacter sp.]|nr:hypothetical protein [Ramlibacter sp.]